MWSIIIMALLLEFFVFCLVALFVEHFQAEYERRNLTGFVVMASIILVSLAPAVVARITPGFTWRQYELLTIATFTVAAIPVIGQQMLKRDRDEKARKQIQTEEQTHERRRTRYMPPSLTGD